MKKEPWHDLYGNNIPPKLEYPTGSMYDAFYKAYKNIQIIELILILKNIIVIEI